MEKTMLNIDITYNIDQIDNFFDEEKIKKIEIKKLRKRKSQYFHCFIKKIDTIGISKRKEQEINGLWIALILRLTV